MTDPCWLCGDLGWILMMIDGRLAPVDVAQLTHAPTDRAYPCPACELAAWIDYTTRVQFDWYPLTGLVKLALDREHGDIIHEQCTQTQIVVGPVVRLIAYIIPPDKTRTVEHVHRIVIDYRVLEEMRRHHPQGDYWTEYAGEDNMPRLAHEVNEAARRLVRSWMITTAQQADTGQPGGR